MTGRPPMPINSWGSITTYEQPSGQYLARARFRDSTGKTRHVSASGRSAAAAKRGLVGRLTTLVEGAQDGAVTGRTTVAQLGAVWLAERATKGCRESTLTYYESGLERLVYPNLGNLRLSEVTRNGIAEFIEKMDAHPATSAYEHSRKILSGMFLLALERNAVRENPVAAMRRRPRTEHATEGMTLEQVLELRAHFLKYESEGRSKFGPPSRNNCSDLLDVLLLGVRIGEALAIRWNDIDLASGEDCSVHICGTIPNVGSLKRQEVTKTKDGMRVLILPGFVRDTLVRLSGSRLKGDANPEDLVFVSRTGAPIRPTRQRKKWNLAVEGTDLAWTHPHVIRAVVATAIDEGLDLKTAAAVLGHSDEAVTREFYIKRPSVAPRVTSVLAQFAPQ